MKEATSSRADKERQHFDLLAERVGEAGTHRTTPAGLRRVNRRGAMLAALLADHLEPRVLEIGAGAGAFSQYILEAAPHIRLVGCDISPKCIEIATKKFCGRFPKATFEVADCTDLRYQEAAFDCVCGCSILHHLPLQETLEQSLRVLKPGGWLWFSEPNMLNPQILVQKNVPAVKRWMEDTEDETAFFRWKMAAALRKTGYVNISVRPFDFLHPNTPASIMTLVERTGLFLERLPLFREIAGSLVIQAQKPDSDM